jgi:5-hydroxyisourate hydrolase
MTSHLSTHVLDATRGAPAENLVVSLARHEPGGGTSGIAQGFTDADGRVSLGPERLEPGMYALTFGTGAWFADHGVTTYYPIVTVTITIDESDRRHHLPLSISPFGYSTYRGA